MKGVTSDKAHGHRSGSSSRQTLTATHQVSIHQKHREVHQNPGGQHEDHSVKAQDVQQPQVVDPRVTQHL